VIKARAAMVMNHRGDGPSSTAAVYAALVWDILVALSKALAAVWTGSASMTSEAIHSFVDTTNETLLLYGIIRVAFGRLREVGCPGSQSARQTRRRQVDRLSHSGAIPCISTYLSRTGTVP
jgi:hypothetical protein